MARYKRGATPKLRKELIEELAAAIRHGDTVRDSANRSGISKDTFYRWLQAGKSSKSTPLLREFLSEISEAMKEAELRDLGLIDQHSQDAH